MVEPMIPATIIGSWSLPGWFETYIAEVKAHPERFGSFDREEATRDAVRLAVDDQLRAGLDRISDGEMQRVDFNLGFYEFLDGLEPIPRARRYSATTPRPRGAASGATHRYLLRWSCAGGPQRRAGGSGFNPSR